MSILRQFIQNYPRLFLTLFAVSVTFVSAAVASEFFLRFNKWLITPSTSRFVVPLLSEANNSSITAQGTILTDIGEIDENNRKIYIGDPILGYKHIPNIKALEVKRLYGQEIYRAHYTIDYLGRRITPRPANADLAILFAGCSFTFGIGVNDQDTLPWNFARLAPTTAVYNYGVAAYGPQHALELFKRDIHHEVSQKQAIVIYFFIKEHFGRAAGTPEIVNSYASEFPWYEISETTGRPIRYGIFRDRFQGSLSLGSKLAERLYTRSEEELRYEVNLTALLLDEARLNFERQFNSQGFYVLIHSDQDARTEQLRTTLNKLGVSTLDLHKLVNKADSSSTDLNALAESWFIPHDGHPNPKLNQIIAERLVEALQKSGKLPN